MGRTVLGILQLDDGELDVRSALSTFGPRRSPPHTVSTITSRDLCVMVDGTEAEAVGERSTDPPDILFVDLTMRTCGTKRVHAAASPALFQGDHRAISKITDSGPCLVWSRRQAELILIGSHIGADPIYYATLGGQRLLFCNFLEPLVRQIRQHSPIAVNKHRLLHFLRGSLCEVQDTFFSGIYRLPAACYMRAGRKGIEIARFWSPSTDEIVGETDLGLQERFREAFHRAISRNLEPDHNGTLLSGGMDSSSIACVAADLLADRGQGLDSFSLLFGSNDRTDERAFSRAVIREKGLKSHPFSVEHSDIFGDAQRLIRVIEEPFEHPSLVPYLSLGECVRGAGVSNLLDGTLGDSALTYDPRFLARLLADGKYVEAVREAVLFTRRMHGEWASPLPMLLDEGIRPWISQLLGRDLAPSKDGGRIPKTLARDFVRLKPRSPEPGRRPRALSAGGEALCEITSLQNVHVLEAKRKIAAACGYRVGFPFSDRSLVELCVGLPFRHKLRDGWTRYILRTALRDTLPAEILTRGGKSAVGDFFEEKLASSLRGGLAREVVETAEKLGEYIVFDEVVAAVGRLREASSVRRPGDLATVWLPYVVGRWLDIFDVGF